MLLSIPIIWCLTIFLWENIWSIDKNDIINLNFYNTCAKIIITSCPSFQLSTGSMESKYFDPSASWKQSFWKCVTNPFLQFSCWQPIFNSPVANKLVQCHYYKKFVVQNDLNAKCILWKMILFQIAFGEKCSRCKVLLVQNPFSAKCF